MYTYIYKPKNRKHTKPSFLISQTLTTKRSVALDIHFFFFTSWKLSASISKCHPTDSGISSDGSRTPN